MSSTLTNLTAATTWSGTDLFYALVGGNSRKIAASSLWTCDAANVLSDVNSTTAQTVRVYRTFTDSSNYERLALQSGSGYMELAAETAGTGTDNLDVRLTPAGTGAVTVTTSTASVFPFAISNTASSSFINGMTILGPNLTAGQYIAYAIGQSNSAGNWAGWYFKYAGNANAGNSLELLFHSGSANANFKSEAAGTVSFFTGLTTPAGGSTNARLLLGGDSVGIYIGSGVPTVSAAQGSIYLRSDGSSSSTRLYVNSSGSTTWVNVTTAS